MFGSIEGSCYSSFSSEDDSSTPFAVLFATDRKHRMMTDTVDLDDASVDFNGAHPFVRTALDLIQATFDVDAALSDCILGAWKVVRDGTSPNAHVVADGMIYSVKPVSLWGGQRHRTALVVRSVLPDPDTDERPLVSTALRVETGDRLLCRPLASAAVPGGGTVKGWQETQTLAAVICDSVVRPRFFGFNFVVEDMPAATLRDDQVRDQFLRTAAGDAPTWRLALWLSDILIQLLDAGIVHGAIQPEAIHYNPEEEAFSLSGFQRAYQKVDSGSDDGEEFAGLPMPYDGPLWCVAPEELDVVSGDPAKAAAFQLGALLFYVYHGTPWQPLDLDRLEQRNMERAGMDESLRLGDYLATAGVAEEMAELSPIDAMIFGLLHPLPDQRMTLDSVAEAASE